MEPVIVEPWGGQGGQNWKLVNADGIVRIMRIIVSYGSVIDGIIFEFEDGETQSVMYKACGGRGGNDVEIDLDSSQEYFTNIRGHVGVFNDGTLTLVSSLTFETNLRTYGPFGTEHGTAFSTSLQNARIVGFHGRCGRYLDSIGVYAVAQ